MAMKLLGIGEATLNRFLAPSVNIFFPFWRLRRQTDLRHHPIPRCRQALVGGAIDQPNPLQRLHIVVDVLVIPCKLLRQ